MVLLWTDNVILQVTPIPYIWGSDDYQHGL